MEVKMNKIEIDNIRAVIYELKGLLFSDRLGSYELHTLQQAIEDLEKEIKEN
jgi:hypothetical protein